jgi:hypothetical protein
MCVLHVCMLVYMCECVFGFGLCSVSTCAAFTHYARIHYFLNNLYTFLVVCLSACLLVCSSACLLVCLSACLLVCLFACLLVWLSVSMPVCLSAWPLVCCPPLPPVTAFQLPQPSAHTGQMFRSALLVKSIRLELRSYYNSVHVFLCANILCNNF